MKTIVLDALLAEATATEQTDASVALVLQAHSQEIKDAVAAQIKVDGFANDQTNTAVQAVIDEATSRFIAARTPIAAAIVANTAPPAPPAPPVEGEPPSDTPAVPPPADGPITPSQ